MLLKAIKVDRGFWKNLWEQKYTLDEKQLESRMMDLAMESSSLDINYGHGKYCKINKTCQGCRHFRESIIKRPHLWSDGDVSQGEVVPPTCLLQRLER